MLISLTNTTVIALPTVKMTISLILRHNIKKTESLKVLIYPLILGNIKTNGISTLSEYLIKYLELVLVSINVEKTILLTSTSQNLFGFLRHKIFPLMLLSGQISTLLYHLKN